MSRIRMTNRQEEGISAVMNRAARLICAATTAAFLAACAPGFAPRWRYDREGQPAYYKRYPRNIAVDYFTRFRRAAYFKVTKPIEDFLTDEQRLWVSRNGQPEYRRRRFLSREGEWVDEWVNVSQNKMVQFTRGRVVYEGDVTDLEKTMITYGYPRGVLVQQAEPEVEFWTFVYSRPFDLERELFCFANGKLVYRQTQR